MRQFVTAHVGNLVGTITWSSLGANSVASQESRSTAHEWEEKVVLKAPATGEVIGRGITDERYTADIEFVPMSDGSSGKNTKAIAAGALVAPAPYAVVTIANHPVAAHNGAIWNYIGGWTVSETQEGAAKVKMRIERRLATDKTATELATEITS